MHSTWQGGVHDRVLNCVPHPVGEINSALPHHQVPRLMGDILLWVDDGDANGTQFMGSGKQLSTSELKTAVESVVQHIIAWKLEGWWQQEWDQADEKQLHGEVAEFIAGARMLRTPLVMRVVVRC